ncbi:MAG: hypothetical protein IAE82_00660 [Opitutaceae bacterium]|nr:hypothetical protein [Opitutaceae bacterium]
MTMKHSYHAHHAPLGAGASFLLGLNGAPGGFVEGAASEGTQDVFVGYRYAGEPWTLLPFVRPSTAEAAGGAMTLLPHGRYGRTLGWATDRWMAQALVLLLATPLDSIADPAALDEARRRVLFTPAVYGLLDFDNSHMEVAVELVFAVGDAERPWRVFSGGGGDLDFDAVRTDDASCAIGTPTRTSAGSGAAPFVGADVLGVPAAGLVFQIPPRGKAVFSLALALGNDVGKTLEVALGQFAQARAEAQRRDDELRASGLGDDARRRVSLRTREIVAARAGGLAAVDLGLGTLRQQAGV